MEQIRESADWGSLIRKTAVIAIPVALQNLLTTTASMVDTMMLAPLGEITVGAVGLCAQFASLMFSCYWGFVGGGMMFFSQYWGAKDDDGIDRAYGLTVSCMLLISAVFCVLALAFPGTVMRIYTDKEVIQEIGTGYLKIVGCAYPLTVLSTAMSCLLRSTERVKVPLYASIASVITNVSLNWVLIYGKFGLPAMGVRGAALASVCAAVVNCLVIILCTLIQRYPYLYHFRAHFRWKGSWLGEYFKKCFPILCNELMMGVSTMVMNIVIGRQAAEAIAAVAVFRTLEGLVIGFFAGFSNAATVLVGKCVGSGELETAYIRAKRLALLCGGFILCLALAVFGLHRPILTAMSLSGESYRIGSRVLAIYCAISFLRMSNWTRNDTFRSAGETTFGTVMEIAFMYILVLPAVCLSGLVWKWPFIAVFACCYLDEPIRFVIMWWKMNTGKWIKPVTPQGKAALPEFREWLDANRGTAQEQRRG